MNPDLLIDEAAIALYTFTNWHNLDAEGRTCLILAANRLLDVTYGGCLPIHLWVQLAMWRDEVCS